MSFIDVTHRHDINPGTFLSTSNRSVICLYIIYCQWLLFSYSCILSPCKMAVEYFFVSPFSSSLLPLLTSLPLCTQIFDTWRDNSDVSRHERPVSQEAMKGKGCGQEQCVHARGSATFHYAETNKDH